MKTSIYSNRIELNNWEILGIQAYLMNNFDCHDAFVYSDKTIHFDSENTRFGIYKISNGEDLYLTAFNDDRQNMTYRLNLGHGNFSQITENFDFVADVENIFEL